MDLKYYIKVKNSDISSFEEYLENNNIKNTRLSLDIFDIPGSLYSVDMDANQALAINLKFSLLCCINIQQSA